MDSLADLQKIIDDQLLRHKNLNESYSIVRSKPRSRVQQLHAASNKDHHLLSASNSLTDIKLAGKNSLKNPLNDILSNDNSSTGSHSTLTFDKYVSQGVAIPSFIPSSSLRSWTPTVKDDSTIESRKSHVSKRSHKSNEHLLKPIGHGRLRTMGLNHTYFDIAPTPISQKWNKVSIADDKQKSVGFDELGKDLKSGKILDQLMQDISELSSEAKKTTSENSSNSLATINEWKSQYSRENESYESLYHYAQMRYREVIEKEKLVKNKPTKVKVAVCADLLLKIGKSLGRYSNIIEPLLYELLNAIFWSYGQDHQPTKVNHSVNDLLDKTTYFDKYHVLLDNYEDQQQEIIMIQQGIQMKDVVKRFQTLRFAFDQSAQFIRNSCFLLWKKYYMKNRSFIEKCRKKMLLNRFTFWKQYSEFSKKQFLDDFSNELDEKIDRLNDLVYLIQNHNSTVIESGTENPNLILFNADIMTNPLTQVIDGKSYVYRKDVRAQEREQHLVSLVVHDLKPVDTNSLTKTELENNETTIAKIPDHKSQLYENHSSICSDNESLNISPAFPHSKNQDIINNQNLKSDRTLVNSGINEDQSEVKPLNSKNLTPTSRRSQSWHAKNATRQSFDEVNKALVETLASFSVGPNTATGNESPKKLSRVSSLSKLAEQALSNETREAIKSFASIAGQIIKPTRNQVTQTPDEWILGGSIYDAQNASCDDGYYNDYNDYNDQDNTSTDITTTDAVEKQTKAKVKLKKQPTATKMNLAISCQLIANIYESKVIAIRSDPEHQKFSIKDNLMEYSREIMNVKYGIKSIAQKHFINFMNCCESDSAISRRIEVFADLLGLNNDNRRFDPKKCEFFFKMLNTIFNMNPKMIAITFNAATKDIDRQLIIESLKTIFPVIEMNDPDLYRNLLDEVLHIPASKGNDLAKTIFKIDIDEALSVLLDYYDFEESLMAEQYASSEVIG